MPAERSHFLHNLLKRSIALFAQFTQKVDRTFCTIYSKGRSHFLHNLLKRSIALLDNLLKRSIALFAQFTQKVDRTFRQYNSKGRSHVWTMQLKRSIARLDNATQKLDRTLGAMQSKSRSPPRPNPASVSDHKAVRSEAGRKPSPSLPKNRKLCQIK